MARIYYAYVLSLQENRISNRVRETQLTQWTMDEIHRTPNRCQVKHVKHANRGAPI
jgi:hypothetical protein